MRPQPSRPGASPGAKVAPTAAAGKSTKGAGAPSAHRGRGRRSTSVPPILVNVHDLPRREGELRQLRETYVLDEDLGTPVARIRAGAELPIDLTLTAVGEGVLIDGLIEVSVSTDCVRCLEPSTEAVSAQFQELFSYPGGRGSRTGRRGEGEPPNPQYVLDGDFADITGPVVDSLIPALPFQPLCSEDCQGLCAECGVRLDDAEPGHEHHSSDPRWAKLRALLEADTSGADASATALAGGAADSGVAPPSPPPGQESGGPAAPGGSA